MADWAARHDRRSAAASIAATKTPSSICGYRMTFTSRPRATARDIAALANPSQAEALLIDRLDDLVAAMSAPGASERVRFARQVVERRGVNLATPDGLDRARQ